MRQPTSPLPIILLGAALLLGMVIYSASPVRTARAMTEDVPPRPTVTPPPTPPGKATSTRSLTIQLHSDREKARPGDLLILTATVTNQKSTPAQRVEVRLPVCKELDILSIETTQGQVVINEDNGTVKAIVGGLQPGDSANITVQARVNRSAGARHSLYNFAKLVYQSSGNIKTKLSKGLVVLIVQD